jgi:ABC-2 type transport system ATP-binding protein
MLKLANVKKGYNGHIVLDIPLLQIESGMYWIKGVNGSGKTTLLKMIAGLIPFQGAIQFDAFSLKAHPVKYRQNVGWAEAEPLFPSYLTGWNLLSLFRTIRKLPEKDVRFFLDLFEMNGYVNKQIETYSAGMVKKLSLVLALLGDQKLIVLDEPLITLDQTTLESLCTFMVNRCTTGTVTFLISSHQYLDSRLLPFAKEITVSNQTVL